MSDGITHSERWTVSTYPLRMYPPSFVERNPGWKPTSLLFEADDCNIVALNLDPEECLELASALIRAANERKERNA